MSAIPVPQRPGQPRGHLLVIVVGELRQRHREAHHDMRAQLPAGRYAALPVASIASSTASRGTADATTPQGDPFGQTPASHYPSLCHRCRSCLVQLDGYRPRAPSASSRRMSM
jgi:hypothetical protein